MNRSIDLNADLGEGYDDEAVLPYVSSCNIACGGHYGDAETIAAAMELANKVGVAIGAHPSYPDKDGFGRTSLTIDPKRLQSSLIEQLNLIMMVAEKRGVILRHVKPHGALYNDAVMSTSRAAIIVSSVQAVVPKAIIVGAPFGELRKASAEAGLHYRAEGFADRQYRRDGTLTPRSESGAMIEGFEHQCTQAMRLADGSGPLDPDGQPIALTVDTICLHGDTDQAAASAKAIHHALQKCGFTIEAPT